MHVQIEVWYITEDLPDLKQCLCWLTVDSLDGLQRTNSFLESISNIPGCEIQEWLVREIDPPVEPTHASSLAVN